MKRLILMLFALSVIGSTAEQYALPGRADLGSYYFDISLPYDTWTNTLQWVVDGSKEDFSYGYTPGSGKAVIVDLACLDFNGSTDQVNLTTPITGTNRTYIANVFLPSPSNTGAVICGGPSLTTGEAVIAYTDSGGLSHIFVRTANAVLTSYVQAGAIIPDLAFDDGLHEVRVEVSRTECSAWIDGTLVIDSLALNGAASPASQVTTVGRHNSGSLGPNQFHTGSYAGFSCVADGVEVCNLPMEEKTGLFCYDASGYTNMGTFVSASMRGSNTFTSSWSDSKGYSPHLSSDELVNYIDLGFHAEEDYTIEIIASFDDLTGTQALFGQRTTSDVDDFMFYHSPSAYRMQFGDSAVYSSAFASDTDIHTFILSKAGFSVDGVLTPLTYTSFGTGTYNCFLYAFNSGSPASISKATVSSFRAWNSFGLLIRDISPLINGSFYDSVEGVIYSNAGSGEFTPTKYVPALTDGSATADGASISYKGDFAHNGGPYSLLLADGTTNSYMDIVGLTGTITNNEAAVTSFYLEN